MDLWLLFLIHLGSCLVGLGTGSNNEEEEEEEKHEDTHPPGHKSHHWNYQDIHQWDSDYPHCGGPEQSPINVVTGAATFDSSLGPILLSGYNVPPEQTLTLENNGHTVVLDLPDSLLIIGGLSQTYRAAQLHFHWGSQSDPGSEHTVNGQRFPGEMHVVHYCAEYNSVSEAATHPGGLAVLAVFIQEGEEENPTFQQLLPFLQNITEEGERTEIPGFDIRGLLPQRLDRYYRYNGSLTTPPCYQTVNWTLFNQTVFLSQEQMELLEDTVHADHDHILQNNFRAPQSLNGRKVLSSFSSKVGGRRLPGAAPNPAAASPAPDDSAQNHSSQGTGESVDHSMSTGDMLAIIFGVLFCVTAIAFFVYVRRTRSRSKRLGSENKANVIYKAATAEDNLA
ncbi:carbonic anhydrase 9 [Xenopus laevis]|uniref:Carbonic anhydrase n=2 Tax=Xenopus laevis TaxID=8355 RepID=A0A974E4B5_XENLA|nr:carbonic anhydrase 9 [Xenopus laevis]OCU02867.1 hypothetical protein XELAEV_18008639mg [Xenopus laevis]